MIISALLGRAVIAALVIAGIYAFAKFFIDASQKGTTNVR